MSPGSWLHLCKTSLTETNATNSTNSTITTKTTLTDKIIFLLSRKGSNLKKDLTEESRLTFIFKVNNKNTRIKSLTSFWCFYC